MPTVFDQAQRWAEQNFKRLEGRSYDAETLQARLREVLPEFPGIVRKKWLFIYSPGSLSPFFEVGLEMPRMMISMAKLGTVASEGGMLLGADFSDKWGTPQSVGKFIPLAVCKPTPRNAEDETTVDSEAESARYWMCPKSHGLTFVENPYLQSSDELDFEVRKWHTDEFSLDQVAERLHWSECGMDVDEEWQMCHFTVYRRTWDEEDEPGDWQAVVDVDQTTGCWNLDLDEKPVNKQTRRLLNHGCSHRSRHDHVTTEGHAPCH